MFKKILTLMAVVLLISSQAFASGTRTFVKSSGGGISSTEEWTWTPNITGKADIQLVTVHFATQSTNEDIRVYLDSELGATYDTVVATSDSVEQNDWTWEPTAHKFIIQKGDNIKLWIDTGSGGELFTATIRGEYQ